MRCRAPSGAPGRTTRRPRQGRPEAVASGDREELRGGGRDELGTSSAAARGIQCGRGLGGGEFFFT